MKLSHFKENCPSVIYYVLSLLFAHLWNSEVWGFKDFKLPLFTNLGPFWVSDKAVFWIPDLFACDLLS